LSVATIYTDSETEEVSAGILAAKTVYSCPDRNTNGSSNAMCVESKYYEEFMA
jgi:hypothetical protein